MRQIVGICVCLLAAAEAGAQTVSPDLTSAVAKRKSVRVTNDAGEEFDGRLLSLDDKVFVLQTKNGDLPFSFQRVSTIDKRGDSLRNGLIIGLVTGTVTGVLSSLGTNDCSSPGIVYPCESSRASTIGGAVAGWTIVTVGIDALKRGWTRIYPPRRPNKPSTP
jgi:hypothetical protein